MINSANYFFNHVYLRSFISQTFFEWLLISPCLCFSCFFSPCLQKNPLNFQKRQIFLWFPNCPIFRCAYSYWIKETIAKTTDYHWDQSFVYNSMRQSGNLTQIFSYSFSRGIQLWKQFVSEIICTILQTVEKLNAAKEAWMRIPLLWFTLQKAWKAAPDWTCRFLHTSKIRHTPLNGLSPILCFAPFQWVPHHVYMKKLFFLEVFVCWNMLTSVNLITQIY